MSRSGTLMWLAVRELWISFRLLALLGAFLVGGIVIALLPPDPAAAMERYAIALGAATALAAAIAAASLGRERQRGMAGWLVSRAVPRRAIVAAWFVTLVGLALAGIGPSLVLTWVAVEALLPWADPLGYALVSAALAASAAAAVAAGLVAGALLPARAAAAAALLAIGAVAVVLAVASPVAALVPGSAYLLLAQLTDVPRPIGSALQSGGAALVVASVLVLVARAALERADL